MMLPFPLSIHCHDRDEQALGRIPLIMNFLYFPRYRMPGSHSCIATFGYVVLLHTCAKLGLQDPFIGLDRCFRNGQQSCAVCALPMTVEQARLYRAFCRELSLPGLTISIAESI